MKVPESLPAPVKSWGVVILMLGAAAAFSAGTRGSGSIVLLSYLLVSAAAMLAFKVEKRFMDFRFGALVLLGVCIAVAAWGLMFNSGQPSDFGVYYRCGIAAGSSMSEWLGKCQSAYLDENSTYWLRSYFYSALIGRFFGDNYVAFKLGNVLLHCLALIAWFLGVRKFYGAGAAAASVVLLAAFPEYWFATSLVTTDNAAILMVVLFLLLLPKLEARLSVSIASALAVGAVAFLGNQLRSIGGIFMVALLLWAVCRTLEGRQWRVAGASLLAFCSFLTVSYAFNAANPTGLPDLVSPMRVLSSVDFHTGQDFGVNYYWAEHFWVATPEASRLANAAYKVSTEFNSGFAAWPLYLFRKSEIIFTGAGYYGLSAFSYPPGNPDSLITDVVNDIPFFAGLSPWLGLYVFALLALSLVCVFKVRLTGLSLSCLVFVAAFGLVVIGAGESQARYSALVAPALSLLAALAIFGGREQGVISANGRSHLIGGGVLVLVYLAVTAISTALPSSETIMGRTALSASTTGSTGDCGNEGVSLSRDYKKLRIAFAEGRSCARVAIPLGPDAASIGFYLSGSKLPFKFEDRVDSPMAYVLSAGGKDIAAGRLGKETVQWVEAPLEARQGDSAMLTVNRGEGRAADYLDVTLIRVSRRRQ